MKSQWETLMQKLEGIMKDGKESWVHEAQVRKIKIEKIEKDCFSSAKQIPLHHKQSKKDNHNPNLQERRQGNMQQHKRNRPAQCAKKSIYMLVCEIHKNDKYEQQ